MVAFPDFEPTRNITRHKLQNKKGCNNSVNGAIIGTSNKGGWTATLPDCFVRKKSEKKAKKGLTDHSANGTMGTLNQRTHRNKETTKMNYFKTSDISITKDSGGLYTAEHKWQGVLIEYGLYDNGSDRENRKECRRDAVEALKEIKLFSIGVDR